MDVSKLAVGGIVLIPLVVGLVQFAKRWLSGDKLVVLAFALGAVFTSVAGAQAEGLIPEAAMPWIKVAVYALAGGIAALSATGLYDLAKEWRKPTTVVNNHVDGTPDTALALKQIRQMMEK